MLNLKINVTMFPHFFLCCFHVCQVCSCTLSCHCLQEHLLKKPKALRRIASRYPCQKYVDFLILKHVVPPLKKQGCKVGHYIKSQTNPVFKSKTNINFKTLYMEISNMELNGGFSIANCLLAGQTWWCRRCWTVWDRQQQQKTATIKHLGHRLADHTDWSLY